MKKYVLFLTDFAYRLPQRIRWWQSFNLPVIFNILRQHNYFPIITHYEDPELFNLVRKLDVKSCISATSYKDSYRKLVNNKLIALNRMGIRLIPNLELMFSYENKGLQADLGILLDLNMPKSFQVSTVEELRKISSDLKFPYVVKTNQGYASKGVSLVRDENDQNAIIDRFFIDTAVGITGIGFIVVQEFIQGLEGDWKVIVVDNVAAALHRKAHENDFRASGSGLFEFIQPPIALLDFAMVIKKKLNAPWVSLDIAEQNENYYLFEYQATHFGTTTTDKAPFYYKFNQDNRWESMAGSVPMDSCLASAILKYLE